MQLFAQWNRRGHPYLAQFVVTVPFKAIIELFTMLSSDHQASQTIQL